MVLSISNRQDLRFLKKLYPKAEVVNISSDYVFSTVYEESKRQNSQLRQWCQTRDVILLDAYGKHNGYRIKENLEGK